MNRKKLARRTANAAVIAEKYGRAHTPPLLKEIRLAPYRIVNADRVLIATATTRNEARQVRTDLVGHPERPQFPLHIEKRQPDGTYAKIR